MTQATVTPIPLPKDLRVESTQPLTEIWKGLDDKQKQFVYHLTQAGHEGRLLLFYQTHRHSLAIRDFFLNALSKKGLPKTRQQLGDEAFHEFLIYASKFMDGSGPYANSNRKYIMEKVTPSSIKTLLKEFAPKLSKRTSDEIAMLMTDPGYEVKQYPESAEGEGLEMTGGNLYERGLTGKEVKDAVAKGLEVGINCRVVKTKKGVICDTMTWKTPGIVGKTLKKVIKHLEAAKKFASTPRQTKQLDSMIQYFKNGKLEDFRAANIEWVRDRSDSPVDVMIGWVEFYEDWQTRIASWESYVQIVDPKVSELAQSLAKRAQRFEDGMPYAGNQKKVFPADYSPPAIMVYYFQEVSSYRTAGYNLPNFDDIRRDVGAKNVIRLPRPGEDKDVQIKEMYKEMLDAFMPQKRIAEVLPHRELVWRNIVLLHEIIGHGSGVYNPAKYPNQIDPVSALGPLGSALEEQRADLAALTFMGDPLLVEVGIYKDKDEATKIRNAAFDYYAADFLRRTSGQRTFTEAHQRGHQLFINWLLKDKALRWVSKTGKGDVTVDNQVLAVDDYDKFLDSSRKLLGKLQDIKAERKSDELKALFDTYAPLSEIDKEWAQAIIRRGKDLKINAGYIEQPWHIDTKMKLEVLGQAKLEDVTQHWAEFY